MEIHKPKPVHGWREFLTEIGIIVLGVLIALAAEQAVEALHWRDKVEQGRGAIRQELEGSAYFAQERIALKPCLEHRLDQLEASLATSGAKWQGEPWARLGGHPDEGAAYSTPIREWNAEVWRSLVADGTAAHLPRDEMLRLTAIYQYVDLLRADNTRERAQIAPVAALGRAFPLGDGARYAAEVALQDQRGMNRMAALGGAQLTDMIAKAGMSPTGPSWAKRMKGLARYAADCEAGRATPITPEGFPAG